MTARRIVQRVSGMPTSDGAGVNLTRLIGQPQRDMLDPFLLLDEFASNHAADYAAGFPEHPHRGFETVTYMLDGYMRHGDNQGNSGLLTPGSVQWMTAGSGIVHSEMPEQEQGLMRGFQLWVNLPAADKMAAPRYQDIQPGCIPEIQPAAGVNVRVVAGSLHGSTGPVSGIATEPVYLDITLQPGATLDVPLPAGHNAFAYLFDGTDVTLGGASLEHRELAVLGDGQQVTLTANDAPARLLLVAGKPLNEPVARYGPFVMTNQRQIREAVADFQAGRM